MENLGVNRSSAGTHVTIRKVEPKIFHLTSETFDLPVALVNESGDKVSSNPF